MHRLIKAYFILLFLLAYSPGQDNAATEADDIAAITAVSKARAEVKVSLTPKNGSATTTSISKDLNIL